jgi:hypothetical protein
MPGLRPSQFVLTPPGDPDWLEIIGIAGDVPSRGLREPTPSAAYIPFTLSIGDNWSLIVRTRSDPEGLLRAVRAQIHVAAPGQPIGPARFSVRTGENILRSIGWEKDEVVSSLFVVFAGLALVLAAIGLVQRGLVRDGAQDAGIRNSDGAGRAEAGRTSTGPDSGGADCRCWTGRGIGLSLLSNKLLAHWTVAGVGDPWVLMSIAGNSACGRRGLRQAVPGTEGRADGSGVVTAAVMLCSRLVRRLARLFD